MAIFSIPRNTFYSKDSFEKLSEIKGKKAAIVTGGNSMKKLGFIHSAEKMLKKAGIESIIIDRVEANPSVKTVKRGTAAMLDFKPDWIIAIGENSTIDAAKVMWCFYEHPEIDCKDNITPDSKPYLKNKARFMAIPSSSGTPSEITAFSVTSDTVDPINYPVVPYVLRETWYRA